mmetsp:Transcript_23882/g.57585  ORF Transcript_23882/g.57585 Transcript_23882/m.57585 type:complete len:224 (+) Transcript_23882:1930-2601(+)
MTYQRRLHLLPHCCCHCHLKNHPSRYCLTLRFQHRPCLHYHFHLLERPPSLALISKSQNQNWSYLCPPFSFRNYCLSHHLHYQSLNHCCCCHHHYCFHCARCMCLHWSVPSQALQWHHHWPKIVTLKLYHHPYPVWKMMKRCPKLIKILLACDWFRLILHLSLTILLFRHSRSAALFCQAMPAAPFLRDFVAALHALTIQHYASTKGGTPTTRAVLSSSKMPD